MRVLRSIKISILLAILGGLFCLIGCDAMDTLLSSAGVYKINAYAGDIPLTACSFIGINDNISPFFEEPVSNDPDITSLIIQLRTAAEDIPEWKVIYSLKNETEEYDDAIEIENLDADLPSFNIPEDLDEGHYTMIFFIMSGKNILQRSERDFYFLGEKTFSYESINVHLPGISKNSQLISRGQLLLLEAKMDFDESLDPYIVWYNGKTKISEGKYSEGAWGLFWKAPEQSNFYQVRAEVFPVKKTENLLGYQKEISIIVSSAETDVNLISDNNAPELEYWYTFEGNLNDTSVPSPLESRAIKPETNSDETDNIIWMPSNGTYGLASGTGNLFYLPEISLAQNDVWQLLFRFKILNTGSIMSVNFGANSGIKMDLSVNEENFVLSLSSSLSKVSQTYNLPHNINDFITMGISFSVNEGQIAAKINVMGETVLQDEPELIFTNNEANTANYFQINLGCALNSKEVNEENEEYPEPDITAVWDEFAVYKNPSLEQIEQEIKIVPVNLTPPAYE